MNDELRELLRDADGGPVGEGDLAAVVSRARATRVTRVATVVLLGVLGVGAVLAVGAGFLADEPDVRFSEPDEPPEDGAVDDDDVDGTGVDGDGVGGEGADGGGVDGGGRGEPEPGGDLSGDGNGAATCELPDLRPTTLPWLAEGEEVPEPAGTMILSESASVHWFGEWDGDPGADQGMLAVSVAVTDRYEPGDEAGTHSREVEVRGASGVLFWAGGPQESLPVSLQWRDAPGRCGVHGVSLLARGDGVQFLGPDFREGGRCEDIFGDEADDECMDLYQEVMEAHALEIVASLGAASSDDEEAGCGPPNLRPTTLPWLADGEEVPEPDRITESGMTWMDDVAAAASADESWIDGPAVTVWRTREPDVEPGARPGFRRVRIRGQPGEVMWVGDPGIGEMGVRWREAPGPCGVHGVSLLTSGDWPLEEREHCVGADPAEEVYYECLDEYYEEMEQIAIDLAESLEPE